MSKPKSKYTHYTDEYRASACVAAIAAGYPQTKGALTRVARELGIPYQLLSQWVRAINNAPPQEILQEKVLSMRDLIENEMRSIMTTMPTKRGLANYGSLGTVYGILFDKLRLLDNLPTELIGILPGLVVDMQEAGINVTEAFQKMRDKLKASNANRD